MYIYTRVAEAAAFPDSPYLAYGRKVFAATFVPVHAIHPCRQCGKTPSESQLTSSRSTRQPTTPDTLLEESAKTCFRRFISGLGFYLFRTRVGCRLAADLLSYRRGIVDDYVEFVRRFRVRNISVESD